MSYMPSFGPLYTGLPATLAGQLGPNAGNVSSLYTGAAPAAARGFMNPGLESIWSRAVQPSLGMAPAIGRVFPRTAFSAGAPPAGMIGYTFPGGPNPLASAGTVPPAASTAASATGANPALAGVEAVAGSAPAAAARGSWMGPNILAEQAAAKGLVGTGARLIRGPGGPMILGQLATQGINMAMPSGTTGNVLADAATMAGIGGTIGSFVAPGIGTAIGAGAGALVGGIYGAIGGEPESGDPKALKKMLEDHAQQLGVGPTTYTTAFDAAVKTGMKDAQGNKMSNKDIAALMTQQMQQEVVTNRAQKEQSAQALEMHKADLAGNLALQTQAQQFMSPYVNNIISGGASQAAVLNKLADQMPAEYKGVFQNQAANALSTSQQIGGAYMAQLAIQPTMQIMESYRANQAQSQQDALRALTLATQMKQQQGGATDFSGLVQQGA